MSDTSFDSNRRLCPDGSCVGVIGPDGRCPECGRSTDGKPRLVTEGDAAQAAPGWSEEAEAEAADDAGAAAPGDGDFDPARRLCDDGSCVGVIGPDGRCGVCGREAA